MVLTILKIWKSMGRITLDMKWKMFQTTNQLLIIIFLGGSKFFLTIPKSFGIWQVFKKSFGTSFWTTALWVVMLTTSPCFIEKLHSGCAFQELKILVGKKAAYFPHVTGIYPWWWHAYILQVGGFDGPRLEDSIGQYSIEFLETRIS